MPSHILVNGLGLTYKSTIGVSTATLPDVCKTPTPGGPVPIPYPNFADQGSLNKGTKTVKAKGNMIAIKGSEYSMSFGDEPGTVGGVTSNTFKKETAWITYSFDVKMDGANACRHTDKKFHNHKNTVDLAGNIDPALPASPNFASKKAAVDRAMNDDIRPTATTEDPLGRAPRGSTAAALYNEMITGGQTKGKWHRKKARDQANRFKRLDDDISKEERDGDLTRGEADQLRDDTTKGYSRNDEACKAADQAGSTIPK